jgi:curved DNA-binding protein
VKDPYAALGVSQAADTKEIKKAYRRLASELHPDKNPGKSAEKRFKDVTRAYEVLADAERRKLYDEFGEISLQSGFDAERARAAQNFGGFGGFGGGGGRAVNLEDLFAGGAGGAASGGFGDMLGDLFRRTRGSDSTGHVAAASALRGRDTKSKVALDFVDAIKGTTLKLTPTSSAGEAITVRIPPGAKDGSRVRVKGQGGGGQNGGPPGDLLLTLVVRPHDHFARDGADLLLDLPITIGEAYRGAQVRVPTPDGEVKLTVPAGTQSGDRLRLRKKGVVRKNKKPGDMFVRFLVRYPVAAEPADGDADANQAALDEAIDVLADASPDPRADIKW